VGVTPCGIHNEGAWVFAHCFGKCFGTFFNDNVAPSDRARQGSVQGRTIKRVFATLKLGDDNVGFEAGFSLILPLNDSESKIISTNGLAFDGASIDRQITEVCQQFLGTVLALHQLEEVRSIINELRTIG